MKKRIALIVLALLVAGCEATVSDYRSWTGPNQYFQQQQQHSETMGALRSIDSSIQRSQW